MKKDILQDIIANKRIEVARQKQAVSLQTLLALGSDRMERDTRSMRAALESSPSGIISEEECRILAETAHSLQLEVLLEVHSEDELKYLNADIDMLGVNNRNLGTFHTDVNNSFKLVDKMRGFSPLLVSESGISETDTVRQLSEAGFRGFLIGETFMKTERPGDTLADFIGGLA